MATSKLNRGLRVIGLICGLSPALACGSLEDAETTAAAAFGPASIAGTWKSGCLAIGVGASENKQAVFTNETVTVKTTIYTDAACTTVDNVVTAAGTYLLNGTTTVATVGELVNIDFTFSSYTWSFVAQPLRAVDYAKACGATNLAGRVDVLGKTCVLGDATTTVFNSPAYGTLAMEGETLILSDMSSNGATAAARSTSGVKLGQKLGWSKQATTN